MPFVQRSESGLIVGRFENAQPGFAEEWLEDGDPALAPKPPSREVVNLARLRAYADPVNGSDRYIAEAYAERAAGNEDAAKKIDLEMVKRRDEIKAENPWSEESK